MTYQVIIDEERLKEFIYWLPELEADETYYLCLFSRSKYCKDSPVKIRSDKQQLKRFTSNKKFMFNKIEQLECKIGTYKQVDTEVPPESLALYINPNPRSNVKAAKLALKKIADLITSPYDGYNLHQTIMSEIQVAKSRTVYFDFDFDNVNLGDIIYEIKAQSLINTDALHLVETRGGFHMLVEVDKIKPEFSKTWYNSITRLKGCDVRGDNLLPVPGTFQGGFIPKLIHL
jgi:hypothetical protein